MVARLYLRLLRLLGAVAGVVISVLAALISLDVLLRNLGIVNFPWLLEVSEYALFITTFIAAPWVLSLGSHVRVDLLLTSVPRPVARLLGLVTDLLGLAVSLTLGWYGLRVTADSFARGDLLYKELVMPEWLLLGFIPFGCALLAIEFLRRLARNLADENAELDVVTTEGL